MMHVAFDEPTAAVHFEQMHLYQSFRFRGRLKDPAIGLVDAGDAEIDSGMPDTIGYELAVTNWSECGARPVAPRASATANSCAKVVQSAKAEQSITVKAVPLNLLP